MPQPGPIDTLVMKPEKEAQRHGETGHEPLCHAQQPLHLTQRRAEIAVAQDVVVAMAGHTVALNHHALLLASGMMLVTDVAFAAQAESGIKIMRDQISRPLGGTYQRAADITDVALGVALLHLAAWLVLIERKMLDAVAVTALWATSRSHLFTNVAGFLHVLLKHQSTPPDYVVWLWLSQQYC